MCSQLVGLCVSCSRQSEASLVFLCSLLEKRRFQFSDMFFLRVFFLHVACLVETKVVFTSPLKDQSIPEEESVTLQCELSQPDQKVTWLKDGKEVKSDRQRGIELKRDARRHSLTIPKTTLDDSAQYTVKCGEQQTKGQVTVEGRVP